MSYDLGGFSVTASTSQVMLIIFAIYSVVIVGFGFYIKYQSKKGGKDGLASFLTGGGGLGAFAIAMIAATNSMAGGTMVAAPGLGYSVGFTAALVYYAGFLTAAYGLGSVGRKVAILRDRTGAVTFQQLLGLRVQSKKVVGALGNTGAFGLTFFAVGQITSGAKVFAAVTGSNSYYLGILLTIVITVIYTVSGGIKSMAKVACIQGVIMLIATFSIIGVLIANNVEQYGSVQATMEYLGTAFPGAIQADTGFSFWNAMGTALFAGVGLGAVPHALSVTMTYNNHKKLKQGVLISCCVFTLIQGIMCFTGPLTRAINPGLETADYTTIFNATNLLPSWMGGIIFCGIFAAIQSSLAGLAMAGASMLAKDFVVDCWKPTTPPKTQSTINTAFVLGISLVATLIALKPSTLTQYMINFALAALAAAWYFPVLVGMYWKKATAKGMLASIIGGFASYVLFYFMSSVIPSTKAWWTSALGGVHAFLPAWLISLVLLVAVSYATQRDRIKLGYFQVFFCEDYDEKYAKIDTLKD